MISATLKHGKISSSSSIWLILVGAGLLFVLSTFWSQTKASSHDLSHRLRLLLEKYEARLQQYETTNSRAPVATTSSSGIELSELSIPFLASTSPDSKSQMLYGVADVKSAYLQMNAKFAYLKTDQFIGGTFRQGKWWEDNIIGSILHEFDKRNTSYCNILDLGVNMGAHTIAYAMYLLKNSARYSQRCTVFGFEPQAGMFLTAVTNVGLNGLGNVQLFNAATVHADRQTVTMSSQEDQNHTISLTDSSHILNFGGLSLGAGGVQAKGLRIDSLGFERVGLIKADIQGSEPLAFYGARELITRDKPLIFYETGFASAEQMKKITGAISPGPVPVEASSFDLWIFCEKMGYSTKVFGQDRLLIPPR